MEKRELVEIGERQIDVLEGVQLLHGRLDRPGMGLGTPDAFFQGCQFLLDPDDVFFNERPRQDLVVVHMGFFLRTGRLGKVFREFLLKRVDTGNKGPALLQFPTVIRGSDRGRLGPRFGRRELKHAERSQSSQDVPLVA